MRKRAEIAGARHQHARKDLIATQSVQAGASQPSHATTPARHLSAVTTTDYANLGEAAALQNALETRAADGLRQIIAGSSREHLYEALSTRTPVDALIHIVSTDAAVAIATSALDDPLRAAKARAARRMTDLLNAEGGPVGVVEVSDRLRISRAAVDKRRRAGTLIGVGDGGRAVLYPGWQFRDTGLLPGLEDVLRTMTIRDPWMRIEFFLSLEPDIGERPLDALRKGRNREVIASAKRYGMQGEDG